MYKAQRFKIDHACEVGHYKCRVVDEGVLITPPTQTVRVTDWEARTAAVNGNKEVFKNLTGYNLTNNIQNKISKASTITKTKRSKLQLNGEPRLDQFQNCTPLIKMIVYSR